ncbi:hypothetical protein [Actinomadura atramentaria]|uniref:hypothetical protein n=1 Tax=Actinomadura atramentaria TaxID=1990 RepID=UPI000379DA7A|nr:hypothetical protein [Actinomadura atramentaria]
MTRRHLHPVPSPRSGQDRPRAAVEPPGEVGVSARLLADALSRARAGRDGLTVQHLERHDGTRLLYLDGGDVEAFVYLGTNADTNPRPASDSALSQPAPRAVTQSGLAAADPLVIQLHPRSEAGRRRLQVLVHDVPALLVALDPSQFVFELGPDNSPLPRARCRRCQARITFYDGSGLDTVLDDLAAHTCRPDRSATARPAGEETQS